MEITSVGPLGIHFKEEVIQLEKLELIYTTCF